METNSRRFLSATLTTAATILPLSALAAPHLDPKIVGHWAAGVPVKPGAAEPIHYEFKPNGIAMQIIIGRGENIHLKATYTTKNGLLTEMLVKATRNGQSLSSSAPAIYKYTVSGDTLTLADTKRPWHLTLHRVKG